MAITNLGNVALKPKGEWSNTTAYLKNDIVSYQGSMYLAKSAPPTGNVPTDTTYWMLSAAKGIPGDAVPITAWSSATAYTVGAKVTYGGSSYYCIANHTNQTPPNAMYWMVIAAKGDNTTAAAVATSDGSNVQAKLDAHASQLADIAKVDGHSLSQMQAVFGVAWDKGESPILTRVGAMSGATVTPGLDATPGSVKTVTIDGTETMTYNRYVAETALFDWPEVTDSYGNVFIRIPKIYLRKIDTPTSLTWYASRMPFEGCYLPKCFWDFENSRELDYVLVGKYKASLSADGLRLESKPDVFPLYNRNIVQFRALARANNTGGLKGYQQLDIHVVDLLQTLFVIQNATLDSQSKAAGYTTGKYTETHLAVVAESAVNRIIVPNATANLYEVGQSIGIGTSQGGQQVAADRIITAIEAYDASNKAIVFDGAPVNIAVGNMLYNTAYKNGFSAALASKFASKISATSGKHPFVWQGIESLWGDIWQFVDGVNINNRQAWVCENADQYTSNVFAEPYKQLSYVNGSVEGYVTAMGFDADRPYASFPVSAGGSSSKFYSDYYYSSEGQRIALFGGDWSYGSLAGLFYWTLNSSSSGAIVSLGGRLLRKPL
jgi:hypothetical protein